MGVKSETGTRFVILGIKAVKKELYLSVEKVVYENHQVVS